jgi:Aspartyl protease
MNELEDILKSNYYNKVLFKVLKTQHLLCVASLNGIKGTFILDTGASNSCVDILSVEKFNLKTQVSEIKASGAGTNTIDTHTSTHNSLHIGRWKTNDCHLVLFDMIHINEGLKQHKVKSVDGIIGADILIKSKAIIDYNTNCFYLKK